MYFPPKRSGVKVWRSRKWKYSSTSTRIFPSTWLHSTTAHSGMRRNREVGGTPFHDLWVLRSRWCTVRDAEWRCSTVFMFEDTRWQYICMHPSIRPSMSYCAWARLLTLRWSEVIFISSWLEGWSLSSSTVSAPLQYRRILPSGLRTE